MERIIRISSDGMMVTCLYFDGVLDIVTGKPRIVRASDVRFDSISRKWFVFFKGNGGNELRMSDGFDRRDEAINYEITILEKMLEDHPIWVDKTIEQEAKKG